MTGRNSAVSAASPPKPPSKSSRNAPHPTTRKRPRETLRPFAPRTQTFGPLFKSIGEPLDPKTLFEGPSGKTRVSVINLAGLASEEARDSFVNRLQMSLFTFIKRNPNPTANGGGDQPSVSIVNVITGVRG